MYEDCDNFCNFERPIVGTWEVHRVFISYRGRYVQTIVKKHAQISTGKRFLDFIRPLLTETARYERLAERKLSARTLNLHLPSD